MSKRIFEMDFRGRKLIVENGEYAKQAHGSVLVRYGDTVILSTVVVSPNANILSCRLEYPYTKHKVRNKLYHKIIIYQVFF